MVQATNRRPDPGGLSGDTILLFTVIGFVVAVLAVFSDPPPLTHGWC